MEFRVAGQHHIRVENAHRVEDPLDLLHRIIGFVAPFLVNERRHVTAGSMFRFKRTIVFVDYHIADFVDEALVTIDFRLAAEALREDEVQVAIQCMAVDHPIIITVFLHQLLQVGQSICQCLYREGNIFD